MDERLKMGQPTRAELEREIGDEKLNIERLEKIKVDFRRQSDSGGADEMLAAIEEARQRVRSLENMLNKISDSDTEQSTARSVKKTIVTDDMIMDAKRLELERGDFDLDD